MSEQESKTPAVSSESSAMLPWYREISASGWRVLLFAMLGWLFEVYSASIGALVLPALIKVLHMTNAQAGLMGSFSAAGLIIGGIAFGWLADRIGRVRSLMLAILIYSVLTFVNAFVSGVISMTLLRFLAGLGMGGAWVSGAALIAETWQPKHRGKGGALMQMGLPLGGMISIGVVMLISHLAGDLSAGSWRWVFGVGILPVIILYPISRRTPESPVWIARSKSSEPGGNIRDLFHGRNLVGLSKAFGFIFFVQYIYWAVFSWTPTFLISVKHLSFVRSMGFTAAQQLGSLAGFIGFALLVDRIGRRPSFSLYLLIGALAVVGFTTLTDPRLLMTASFFTGFGVTGLFAGMGPFTAEMVPQTSNRAFAMGLAYNGGRIGGIIAPLLVGALATTEAGFQLGLLTTVVAFLFAWLVVLISPETKGVELS